MPFINTRTSCEITKEKETAIKTQLGEAIKLIGKSESWLMLNFEDNCRLYFKGGNSENMAMVEIALFGKATSSQYDALTAKVTEIISSELSISPSCIYVKYEEVDHWDYSGFNF
ncbi:MAG: hypothetical protein IJW86_06110 [Clostridia bacterium]|nr:hypothetical protein [Clostridia bacterium]